MAAQRTFEKPGVDEGGQSIVDLEANSGAAFRD